MGKIFLAEGTAQIGARGQEQLVVGNAKHMCVHFYFGGLHCGMEGFVHRKAIPDITSLIEEVFWDVRRGESPFPGACKNTLGRQLSPKTSAEGQSC